MVREDLAQSHTHRLVLYGRAGDAQVQLAVLLDAGVDESLNRALVLEEQEGVPWEDRYSQVMDIRTSDVESGSYRRNEEKMGFLRIPTASSPLGGK